MSHNFEYESGDENRRQIAITQLNQLLVCLALLTSTSDEAVSTLLDTGCLDLLPALACEPVLYLNCFRVYRTLSRIRPEVVAPGHYGVIVDVIQIICESINAKLNEPPPDPKAKGGKAKGKDDPSPINESLESSAPYLLSCITLLTETVTMCAQNNIVGDEDQTSRIISALHSIMLLPGVWSILQERSVSWDIRPHRLAHHVCVLIGSVSCAAGNFLRSRICIAGGLKLVTSILEHSAHIVTSENVDMDKDGKASLSLLHRLCEQALLFLITYPGNESNANQTENSKDATSASKNEPFTSRQMGLSNFFLDEKLFSSDSGTDVSINLLTDMLGHEVELFTYCIFQHNFDNFYTLKQISSEFMNKCLKDTDVSARAVRVFGLMLSNCKTSPVDFLAGALRLPPFTHFPILHVCSNAAPFDANLFRCVIFLENLLLN